jgi:hypothetical protein
LQTTSRIACMVFLFMVPNIKAMSEITLVVSAEATMSVEAVEPTPDKQQSSLAQWFRVDLAVRLNPGAEARLFVEPAITGTSNTAKLSERLLRFVVRMPGGEITTKSIGSYPETLHLIRSSGRQSVVIGIESKSPLSNGIDITDSIQIVLKSSDGAFLVKRTIPKTIGIGNTKLP